MASVIRAGSITCTKGASKRSRKGRLAARERAFHELATSGEVTLSALIQGEIIPRLLISHPAEAFPMRIAGGRAIDPDEAIRFAQLPLELEADELMEEIEGHIARGVAIESIFVDLLAPAARRLGQYWEEDRCDFVDVTMGLWRLQEVMRGITQRHASQLVPHGSPRSALFSPMPGEQHSFGALMVEEVFARAGWQSEVLIEPRRQELLAVVAQRPFQLVGLTISCDYPSGTLAELITSIRTVSKFSTTQIFIGGRMANSNPELVKEVGADGTAPDARSALALAERKIMGAQRLDLLEP